MKVHKAYKFRIQNPSKPIIEKLDSTLNLCRELYNSGLQERREAWKLNRVSITYLNQANQLSEIKEILHDLNSVYSQVLQDVLKRLDKTFKSFFRRVSKENDYKAVGFPRFKGQNRYNSFTYPQSGFTLSGNKLTLSKIGILTIKLSRKVIGKIKTLSIKKEIGKWFAVFTVETEAEILPKTNLNVGLDVGIERFATLSNGTTIENKKFFQRAQKEIRRLQRSLVRKKKGSNNRKKAVIGLKKIHRRIRNQRLDFLQKITTKLIKSFDVICIEKLNILGMSKGMLAKQINDAGWRTFFNLLKYKAESADKWVIEMNPNGTSQNCSQCREVCKKVLSVRLHHCQNCGLKIHRDHNAALNILRLGTDHLHLTKSAAI